MDVIILIITRMQKFQLFICVGPFIQINRFNSPWILNFLCYNTVLIITFIRYGFAIVIHIVLQSIISTLQLYQIILNSIGRLSRRLNAKEIIIVGVGASCANVVFLIFRVDSWFWWETFEGSSFSIYFFVLHNFMQFVGFFIRFKLINA